MTSDVEGPCRTYRCSSCCVGTEMPLGQGDIERIERLGYEREQFIRYIDGVPTLAVKEDGSCVFLHEGMCTIYEERPEGCRLYPLVWARGRGRAMLDPACPHRYEFRFSNSDIERLRRLVVEIYGERAL